MADDIDPDEYLGGHLDVVAHPRVGALLDRDEYALLKSLSDADPEVRAVVAEIEAMPDLTEAQWRAQAEAIERWKEQNKHPPAEHR